MGDELSASAMVQYFGSCMAQLRGRAVYVQFSNHKELKTDQSHSNAVSLYIWKFTIFKDLHHRILPVQLPVAILYGLFIRTYLDLGQAILK